MNFKILILIFGTLLFSYCSHEKKFDKALWQQRGDLGIYPERTKMLNDLLKNNNLKGLTYKQVINLLGIPEKYADGYPNIITYNIEEDYRWDIDPVYIKNLDIEFNSDSVVTEISIREINH